MQRTLRRFVQLHLRPLVGKKLLVVLGCALLLLLRPSVAFGQESNKNALVFYSDGVNGPAASIVDHAIRSTLKEGQTSPIQIYDESIDSFRIPTEKYDAEMVKVLQRKYEGVHLDLIFAISLPALKFVLQHRSELFLNVPIVFLVNDQTRVADLDLRSNISGVWGKVELTPTLDMALAAHPETQNVVVTAGNAPLDRDSLALARKEFRAYEGRASFTYLTDLTPEELRQRLSVLPDRTVVMFLSFNGDRAGKRHTSPEVVSQVSPNSRAPIYASSEIYLGHGIVGGRLLSYEALGLAAGKMGLRILVGESAQSIPPQTVPSVTMFDWRELRRWGIDESTLPAGSIVRYREPTFWDQYKWHIIGVISLCVLEAFLIVLLLVSRARRRQAQEESRRLAQVAEAERRHLDEVVSNVPGVVWESRVVPGTNERRSHFVSDYVEEMLGYSVQEWAQPGFAMMIIPEEDRNKVVRATAAIMESGKPGFLQFRWTAKDGSLLWVEAHVNAVCDEAGKTIGLRGVTMDITERRRAEEALRESEHRFQLVSQATKDILYEWNLQTDFVWWNDSAMCSVFGYPLEEMRHDVNWWEERLHPEDRDRIDVSVSEALGGVEQMWENEYRFRKMDNSYAYVYHRAFIVRDEGGQALKVIGSLMDVTERRLAAESLRESEERLNQAISVARFGVFEHHHVTNVLHLSPLTREIHGWGEKDSPGLEGIVAQLHPEDRVTFTTAVRKAHDPSGDGFFSHEYRIVIDGGKVRWVSARSQTFFEGEGGARRPVRTIGAELDITERKEAEEALRVSESRFRTMADSAPLLIWMCGPDSLCSYVNQGWLEFTGRTFEQELGNGWAEGIFSEDYAPCWENFVSAFDRREPFRIEYRLRRGDGVFRWVYTSGTPRFSSEGEFLGYIGSCIDIADRKEAEEALQIAHEEVSKLKNQLQAENIYLQEEIKLAHNVDEIVGQSNAIKYVLFKIEQVAETNTTVLILGETGTGKELVARALHSQSQRKDRPLVKVNCAALSASLIESELFGHEKGAFTGASARKIGRFELADGATIFLDEIGELPLELQPKLLRVIQEGEFERLGSARTIKVDVRIIAATNRNMKAEVEKGAFREDLWYRLNVFPITAPPLRQRKEDIPAMVEHFVAAFSKRVGKTINSISSVTLKKLQNYSWPGNVRELANVLERAVITGHGSVLHIAEQFEQAENVAGSNGVRTLEEIEKEYITHVLDQTAWRIEGPNGAARLLGLNPSTLRTRMVKLGIQKSIRGIAGSSAA